MKTWVTRIVWILIVLTVFGLIYFALYLGKSAILWLFIIYFG